MSERCGIVADGRERCRKAVAQEVRARFRQLYRERARELSWLGRVRLRLSLRSRMRRELERKLDELAPPGASYIARP